MANPNPNPNPDPDPHPHPHPDPDPDPHPDPHPDPNQVRVRGSMENAATIHAEAVEGRRKATAERLATKAAKTEL